MPKTISTNTALETHDEKIHPWRICPVGKHFVREHVAHMPPSKTHPDGSTSIWHEHCANNPSHKDELSYHEIQYIAETYFRTLKGSPATGLLTKIFSAADDYDLEIRGWVRYWNDIFHPNDMLDANLIKALIGTESSFIKSPPKIRNAHGLMQIRNDTFLILQNPKGELTNYLIRTPREELLNPSVNICMGIRWLFQKKKLASIRLKREASWEEAIIEYKSYWEQINVGKIPMGIQKLREYYGILQGK